jgi:anti-anti-sigma factor
VAFLSGELDAAAHARTSGVLSAALQDAVERDVPCVEVDLSAVSFIDSTGMSALVATRRAALSAGRRFLVREASAPVRRLFSITKLDEVFGLAS